MRHLLVWYALLLATIWPLYDHILGWPHFLRELANRPHVARTRMYAASIVQLALLSAIGYALASSAGVTGGWLTFLPAIGWRRWVSAPLPVILAALYVRQTRQLVQRSSARQTLGERLRGQPVLAMLPRTLGELRWFLALSIAAGVCEEFLFRGYLIVAMAPAVGWWLANALSLGAFALLHTYQGRQGPLQSGIIGLVMAIVVAVTRSLFPAMALHAVIDIGSGVVLYTILCDSTPTSDVRMQEAPAELPAETGLSVES